MRKFTFIFVMLLGFLSLAKLQAQTIEDFENIKMNLFSQGTTGALSVIPNPDPTGADTSLNVCKMVIGMTGRDPWAGWYAPLPVGVDVVATPYLHIKVWKPTRSHVDFKLEQGDGTPNVTGDIYPINVSDSSNATTGAWEELVYNYSAFPETFGQLVLIPDFHNAPYGDADLVMYFDDMYVNNDPAVGSAPVRILEDFEPNITMNLFAQGTTGTLSVVDNPDVSGINLSGRVGQLVRAKDGDPWEGWYSPIAVPVNPENTRYAHVKVWKPRISPVDFKLEQGTGTPNATGDVYSVNAQTLTNAWEDMVFDYGTFTGEFSQIVLIPDFMDPVNLDADFTMYFDDIIFNNDPEPKVPAEQIIQVNMGGYGLNPGDRVYISGTFGGVYGTWTEPGTVPQEEMFDTDGDGIYTIYMHLPDGATQFKFFVVPAGTPGDMSWDFGDNGQPNRAYTFAGDANLIYVWGDAGFEVSVPTKPATAKVSIYPNPVHSELIVSTTSDLRSATITNMVGKVVGKVTFNNAGNKSINTSNLSSGMYFVTFVGKDGNKVTQKLVKE